MDTVVDIIPTGESVISVKADPTAPIDLLGRQEIVDRIMKILEVISEKKSSCTLALNGAWGTGKTFVLNMLMNQLWEGYSDKYIVFHYNCWQYDYYEEPLIAIVAAMLDSVDEKTHLLSEDVRTEVKVGIELAKDALKKIGISLLEKKIGVDFTEALSVVKQYQEAIDNEKQALEDSRSFDVFYSVKKAIEQAQEEIRKLSKDHTLVVVVDELDRCLPSYAIKVLERLHHLFAGIENSTVILAVDKTQLDNTVFQIFGHGTDTTKYLRKFVNIELNLDIGSISGNFRKKHQDYFDLFDESLLETDFKFDEFLVNLFSKIDARTQDQLIERIKTVHMMLFPSQKKDYSFLCCELIWIVFQEIYGGCALTSPIRSLEMDTVAITRSKEEEGELLSQSLQDFLLSTWAPPSVTVEFYSQGRYDAYILHGTGTIQKILLYYLSHLQDNDKIRYYLTRDDADNVNRIHPIQNFNKSQQTPTTPIPIYKQNLMELKTVVELLEIIQ